MNDKKTASGGKKKFSPKKAQEYLDGWQRARADYDNLKREMDGKIATVSTFAKVSIVEELLPILNNFSAAISHVPEEQKDEGWVVGIFHIQKQLEDCLENIGFKKIQTAGESFDPQKHEAVGKEKGEAGIIIKEVSAGYEYNGDVVIPTKVVVGE